MSGITIKIDKTVQKNNMLQKGDFVVVGVSGGADSMLLLSYLMEKKTQLDLKLLVANVEHGIRGEESLSDSKFVEAFCKENEIPFECLKINAPALSKEAGEGIEEFSRKKRYEFFESFGADKIATAHNLSDNVETVLFRLSRGTSINGCCGIPAVRGNIIRPLIEISSSEIRSYCKENNIPFVVDSTNKDNNYSRNYIRNVVIKDFERLNPSFEKSLERFINSASEDNDYLSFESEKCFESCLKGDDSLDIEKLREYHSAIIKRVIILLVKEQGIIIDELHLNGVFELINKRGKYQIKDNLFAISDLKALRIERMESREFDFSFETKKTDIQDFLNNCELLKKEFDFYFDCDKISGDIIVRKRAEGDRISPKGRGCSKSLKKLFNELKIPEDKRIYIPVIADNAGVISVAGCVDERVCIGNETKNVLLIRITEDKF